jgi:uncharacterized protein (TIGR02452 family)
MNNYWNNKEELSKKAFVHTCKMAEKYSNEIKASVAATKIYDDSIYNKPYDINPNIKHKVRIMDTDSVSAIEYQSSGKTAVLNFADYTLAGGLFLKGSSAQEESLCHESFLYNVLSQFPDYYKENKKTCNYGLYSNRAIYTPDIIFKDIYKCDVITCAAPNLNAIKYRCKTSKDLEFYAKYKTFNKAAMYDRIKFVYDIAAINKVDTLILGAWGCGVFGQNPTQVAHFFRRPLVEKKVGVKNIIFAIPTGENYDAFIEVFNSD